NLSLTGAGAEAEQVLRVGTELSSSNVDDADVRTYARLGVRGVESGRGFRLRDCLARRESPEFQGTQAVTWALNHSGLAIHYAAPAPAAESAPELYRPSPNPFARTTRFAYAIPGSSEAVEIGVFDVAGRQVRNLIRETQSAGRYEVAWDGRNDAGDHVRNGIY